MGDRARVKRSGFGVTFRLKVALAVFSGDKITTLLAAEYDVHADQVTF